VLSAPQKAQPQDHAPHCALSTHNGGAHARTRSTRRQVLTASGTPAGVTPPPASSEDAAAAASPAQMSPAAPASARPSVNEPEVLQSKPSREELRLMRDDALAEVLDFELSRPGHGSLRWPGKTDLRGLVDKLDVLVKILEQKVIVYPPGIERPPAGHGLNKRCIYVMEGVWPRDKGNRERLRDARSLQRFKVQLQRNADRVCVKMLGYDEQAGVWSVEVADWSHLSGA